MPFIECPKKFQYKRVRGIGQGSHFLVDYLSIGLLIHVAKAQWLYDGRPVDGPRANNWRAAMARYEKESPERLHPVALSYSVGVFEKYVEHWSIRPHPEVLAVEHQLGPRPLYAGAPAWTARTARLDGIVRWRGKTWIDETKTTARNVGKVHDLYMLHVQTLLGCTLWSAAETKRFGPLGGVLLDVIVKPTKKKGPGFAKVPLPIDQMAHALVWFRKDFTTWIQQAESIQWNDHVERRPAHCDMCEMRRLCLRGRNGANGFSFQDGTALADWRPSPGKETAPWL